jgi:hypothetical protein
MHSWKWLAWNAAAGHGWALASDGQRAADSTGGHHPHILRRQGARHAAGTKTRQRRVIAQILTTYLNVGSKGRGGGGDAVIAQGQVPQVLLGTLRYRAKVTGPRSHTRTRHHPRTYACASTASITHTRQVLTGRNTSIRPPPQDQTTVTSVNQHEFTASWLHKLTNLA